MRKQIFTIVDMVLPRWLARFPYEVALWTMKVILGPGLGVRIWKRNSVRSGSFIMGVSDLDLTILYRDQPSFEFLDTALKVFKRAFLFLGEANIYWQGDLDLVLPRMNGFELKRDPDLEKLVKQKTLTDAEEKFVFTQRMLFSDIFTLKGEPTLRQRKWKGHFDLMGVNTEGQFIDLEFVVQKLKEFSRNNGRIAQAIDLWKSQVFTTEFDVYHASLGEGFKILAPHCHLWFHRRDERDFLRSLDDMEKKILKRQIDWEFAGLYSQRLHLDKASLEIHFKRLLMAYRYVTEREEFERLERDIALVFGV